MRQDASVRLTRMAQCQERYQAPNHVHVAYIIRVRILLTTEGFIIVVCVRCSTPGWLVYRKISYGY
jgi:hypothetical protein